MQPCSLWQNNQGGTTFILNTFCDPVGFFLNLQAVESFQRSSSSLLLLLPHQPSSYMRWFSALALPATNSTLCMTKAIFFNSKSDWRFFLKLNYNISSKQCQERKVDPLFYVEKARAGRDFVFSLHSCLLSHAAQLPDVIPLPIMVVNNSCRTSDKSARLWDNTDHFRPKYGSK